MGVLPDRMIERDVKIEPFAPQQHRPGLISFGVTSYGYDARVGYVFDVFSPVNAKEIDPKNFDKKSLVRVDLTPQIHDLKDQVHRNTFCDKCGLEGRAIWDEPICRSKSQPLNYVLIPPHSFALAETVETFTIPRNTLCVVLGKSTYARCGLIVNVTPGEPEWTGKWTVELSNTTPLPIRVYAGEGIMQCIFIRSDEREETLIEDYLKCHGEFDRSLLKELLTKASCGTSYADKRGKYMHQTGLTAPIVEGEKK